MEHLDACPKAVDTSFIFYILVCGVHKLMQYARYIGVLMILHLVTNLTRVCCSTFHHLEVANMEKLANTTIPKESLL